MACVDPMELLKDVDAKQKVRRWHCIHKIKLTVLQIEETCSFFATH